MSTVRDQAKAFMARILRLKEEQDALTADIREVYSEAKESGLDKTALGQAVAAVRRREKLGAEVVGERDSLTKTYLQAYLGTSYASQDDSTHAHEAEPEQAPEPQPEPVTPEPLPPHDPETGEVHDDEPAVEADVHETPVPATNAADDLTLPKFLNRRLNHVEVA